MDAVFQSQRTAFDCLAESYDRVFTDSLIGRAQRDAVWRELETTFFPGHHVLELNCGTGVDAVYLAERGVRVDAFDSSPAMIRVAQRRLPPGSPLPARFQVLATEDLGALHSTYDGAFSNFAGLNCVANLREVARNLGRLVRPLGHVLLCLASPFCAWETCWWLANGNPGKAFRRLRPNGASAELAPRAFVRVHYPSMRTLRRLFEPEFSLVSARGIGLFVPPSCLERHARRFPYLVRRAAHLDTCFSSLPGFRQIADHILLKFRRISR